ncbi:hypothetical protein [Dethiosulfatarculus sandiegensis]|uniref:Uncharacterized protein n=1 Tax=Dethiosulfatarculus sandiegensis TaxID=1429043 RepID=A0A0D2G9P5_9BACT|nr:hypothetical protein [Dethiosulfatarculus sandiegensis]KIX11567.1 hypothetical protein X474_24470 [Dethiosulfatarculus sandiegensis]
MPLRKPLRILVICLFLFSLTCVAGCFDYTVELTLQEKGSGIIDISLDMPRGLAGDNPPNPLDSLLFPIPRKKTEMVGDRVIIKEFAGFSWPDLVVANRVWFEVERIRVGVLGITDYTYRLTTKLRSLEGELPDRDVLPGRELEQKALKNRPTDPAEIKARSLLARSLVGHHVTLRINLPGEVTKTYPLVLGTKVIEPVVSEKRAAITWQVPLSTLANEQIRDNMVFRVEFQGVMDFRGKGQTLAHTRYPKASDLTRIKKEREKALKEGSRD